MRCSPSSRPRASADNCRRSASSNARTVRGTCSTSSPPMVCATGSASVRQCEPAARRRRGRLRSAQQAGYRTKGLSMKLPEIVWISMLVAVGAQDPLYFPPADRGSVRVMSELSPIDLAPGVHVRTVVGATGSVSIGEFEPGSAAVLHHHTREQADVGLTGAFDMTIGTHVEKLGPDMGVIVPSNVAHSIANKGTGVMTVVEFHTVPRPDLVPPRPAMTFPSSAVPASVPEGRALVKQIDGPGGPTNASPMIGETCIMRWRRLARGAPTVD